ncbi:uncharacterized protein LOC18097223 isoform X3 [Populus trichocarpa]|uniref:uncharacterized protein LOC18097223 isoform X3 n=1 Tax=Populus trichocarpa TaxID=3694 RepID=UPI002277F2DD|nr:uncharacterized protein LOC18097223 isoform X3 [Populus trichocarpa]
MLDSDHGSNNRMSEAMNYQTISSNDLARLVLAEGGWSNLLKRKFSNLWIWQLFLLAEGYFCKQKCRSSSCELSQGPFTKSNFSMAFPYVAASEEAMENSLVSGFAEACGQDLGISNVSFSESCSVEGESFQKLAKLHAVNDYLASRMEKRLSGQPNLVVFCYGGSNSMKELDQPQSESEMFSELINSVEMLGGKYVVLYVSDPFRSIQLPYHQELERFLAEGAGGNASLNSTHCDEVCQIKSSFLEGVLVGMVIGDGLIMNGKFLAVSRSVFILCMSCL